MSANNQSATAKLFRAATLVMALFIVSRALGLFREMVIAYQFGTTAEMDAYLAAFRVPDFLFYAVSGGALGSAFIPVFTGHLTRQDMLGAWRLASAVINTVLLVLGLLCLVMAIFAPTVVSYLYSDLTTTQQLLTIELMRWMLISTMIFGVSGVVMGILNAHQHFLLPALAPVIYNLGIIFGAVFLGETWGVKGLTIGVVLGALGHLLIQIPGLVRYQMKYQPVFGWHDENLHEVIGLMLPRMVGIAAVQVNFMVNAILATQLTTGSLTALNYGWIVMLLPQGIIAQSVATALFPTLSTLVSQGKRSEMRYIFGTTLQSMLFLTLPATAGLVIWGRPIIRLLFERGEFDATSTEATVWALAFFSVGLIGHAVVEIATRAFYALKNTRTPVMIAIVTMIINVILSIILMRGFAMWSYPAHAGLALANSVAVMLEMVVLLWLLHPEMGGLVRTGFGSALAKMSLATGGMAVTLLLLPATTWWLDIWGIILGGGVYFLLAYLLGLQEIRVLVRKIAR
ncbi:murein biosynthesis integral membrane protein MurJ [Anaerolineales bacterium HSG25]|nr:murein biosynthesis integral membrane protein MurJ [Anaerolineales bacterium HSG25]